MSVTDSLKKWLEDFKAGKIKNLVESLGKAVTEAASKLPARVQPGITIRADEPYVKNQIPVSMPSGKISPTVVNEFHKYIKTNFPHLPEDFLTISKAYSRSAAGVVIGMKIKDSKAVRKYLEKVGKALNPKQNFNVNTFGRIESTYLMIMEDNLSDELLVNISVSLRSESVRKVVKVYYNKDRNPPIVVGDDNVPTMFKHTYGLWEVNSSDPFAKFFMSAPDDAKRVQAITRIIKTLSRKAYGS